MKPPHTYTKPLKLTLGAASVWPIIYIPIFFMFIFTIFMHLPTNNEFPPALLYIFPLHLFTIILSFVVLGFFIYDVMENKRLKGDKKLLWIILLLLINMFANPVYWYLYIWKMPTKIKKK